MNENHNSAIQSLNELEFPACAKLDTSQGFISLVVLSCKPARSESVIPTLLIWIGIAGLFLFLLIFTIIVAIEEKEKKIWEAIVLFTIFFLFALLGIVIVIYNNFSKTWITVTKDNLLLQRGLKPGAEPTYLERDSAWYIDIEPTPKWYNVYIGNRLRVAEEITEEDAKKLKKVLEFFLSENFDPEEYINNQKAYSNMGASANSSAKDKDEYIWMDEVS